MIKYICNSEGFEEGGFKRIMSNGLIKILNSAGAKMYNLMIQEEKKKRGISWANVSDEAWAKEVKEKLLDSRYENVYWSYSNQIKRGELNE